MCDIYMYCMWSWEPYPSVFIIQARACLCFVRCGLAESSQSGSSSFCSLGCGCIVWVPFRLQSCASSQKLSEVLSNPDIASSPCRVASPSFSVDWSLWMHVPCCKVFRFTAVLYTATDCRDTNSGVTSWFDYAFCPVINNPPACLKISTSDKGKKM
jgi:hypothetical protein